MRFILLSLLLMFASPAFAVDGDALTGGCAARKGSRECRAYYLCDSDTAAVTCTEFDLESKSQGYPSYFVVTLLHATGCPASGNDIEVQVRGAHVTDTDEKNLNATVLQLDGNASKSFDTDFRFIDAVLTSETDFTSCSDIDVAIVLYYER